MLPLPKKYRNIRRDLKVRKSSAGLGLYTNAPIEKKGFVIEYIGEVISDPEANRRGTRYLFRTSQKRVIDGSGRSNIARYINHSCKPNCEIEIFRGRIYVFALRSIKAGEEITYDYGEEYFDQYLKPVGCRCESCSAKK